MGPLPIGDSRFPACSSSASRVFTDRTPKQCWRDVQIQFCETPKATCYTDNKVVWVRPNLLDREIMAQSPRLRPLPGYVKCTRCEVI